MFVISIIIVILFNKINSECGLNIRPKNGNTIICDNTCDTCGIICDEDAQCKDGITIYSSALKTIINCFEKNSCKIII